MSASGVFFSHATVIAAVMLSFQGFLAKLLNSYLFGANVGFNRYKDEKFS